MAITFDAKSMSTNGANASSVTWSHTVATGANILVITIACRGGSPTGVTFDSVSATSIISKTNADGYNSFIYYLMNPNSGTHTVSVTTNGTIARGGAISFFNAYSSPIGATANSSGTSVTGDTLSITPTKGTGFIVDTSYEKGTVGAITYGSGQTGDSNNDVTGHYQSQTRKANNSLASTNMVINWTNTITSFTHVAVEIIGKPLGGAFFDIL